MSPCLLLTRNYKNFGALGAHGPETWVIVALPIGDGIYWYCAGTDGARVFGAADCVLAEAAERFCANVGSCWH